jgi:ubiquinone/menaquinone biosynthesis C-methylase UbiE
MHGLLKHLPGSHDHSHAETAPQTTGNVIHWAEYYGVVVQIMLLGQAGRLRRLTVDRTPVKAGDHVLDVGCGTGDLTLVARERAGSTGQVAGIDPSPEMIEVARGKARRKHADVDFRVGVIERLPYSDGSFDVVLSSMMMHHLQPEDLKRQGLREVRRVLRSPDVVSGKPGGRLVIIDFKGLLEEQNVVALVKEAGFTRVEMQTMWLKQLGVIRAA